MSNIAIGIDLGTTYSCVAVWKNIKEEKPEIIPIDGKRTTPSVISFKGNERLIGQNAKNEITKNYSNTIYDIKRLIGRKFNDKIVQEDILKWPFKVEKDTKSERPVIIVDYLNKKQSFYPEEILAMLLLKIKKASETFLNQNITNAVITVPAHFNDSQRQSTTDAGRIAGLNVLRIINEPTAAAIAYGLENKTNKEKYILVYDLGGGTFDVSILLMYEGSFIVKSTNGNTHLGGEDFDNRLMEYCIEVFKKKNNVDLNNDKKALRRLKLYCEKAKISLSNSIETIIDIENISEDKNLYISILRNEFEQLCEDLFQQTLPSITECLKDAKLNIENIEDVILTGGSTRIPYIQEMVKNYFNGKEIKKNINVDEAVAIGASIQAKIIINNYNEEEESLEQLVVVDVCPLSLGMKIRGGINHVIIPRNTIIPIQRTQKFYTSHDNQEKGNVEIYQGERKLCKDNYKLGGFLVDIIQREKKGKVRFDITFNLNENSILEVTAKEFGKNDNVYIMPIKADNGKFTEEEIENLIKNAKVYEEEDLKKEKDIKAKIHLLDLCFDEKNNGNNKANDILKWIKNNPNLSEKEYREKEKELYN